MRRFIRIFVGLLLAAAVCHASVFSDVEGVVHDAQHRPVAGAAVELRAQVSARIVRVQTDAAGRFRFAAVPFGAYEVVVSAKGFATVIENVNVVQGALPVLHVMLPVGEVQQSVSVGGDAASESSVMPTVTISAGEIDSLPGATRSDSLAMITDTVPGAYITHDMLHMRGGHQVSWLLDGVEIPNTNIASNLGPQVDPRDIEYLQVDRGSYNADLGDRTYGVFNVNSKSGFERDREAELRLTVGSALSTDDQLSFGDHSVRAAYYASVNASRSDYGLSPPIEEATHDAANGYGGFGSVLFNKDTADQLRVLGQWREDFFQIPYDPNAADYENQLYDSSGLRDTQHEKDGVAALTWTHEFARGFGLVRDAEFSLAPFYHYNRALYEPGASDTPAATMQDRSSQYGGVQTSVSGEVARNRVEAGFYAWGQHDNERISVNFTDSSYTNFTESDAATGGLIEEYVADNFKPVRYLTLLAGVRESWFTGGAVTETATSPRFGIALEVPRLGWVFRAFYGHFYQPPPLLTVSSPLLLYAYSNNVSFAPLHGERDEEHQFGVQIPWKGWLLDADTFQTEAANFLDHTNIGESSVYVPVTVQGALIQAWELTLKSPRLWHDAHVRLAYSNQIAQQRGPINGGPGCYPLNAPQCAVDAGYTPLDHDQRNTLNVGGDIVLPLHLQASTNIYYGSGFTNGYTVAPSPYTVPYLPPHTTFDLRLARKLSEHVEAAVTATNVANRRVLLDNSLTFGGFHENDPRQVYAEVRWRWRY